ncbi:hypothetical protein IWW48_005430 [Coemansia sp. RSA 1200]|nr:hypothetical protein IWW48_005430 [Coemansia sp. RSA 1200]
MQLTRAIALAALSAVVSSSVIPIKRDSDADKAALSSMLSSVSEELANPTYASYLLSSALGYISSELPSDQKPIKQADLESIVSKYAPEVAPSMVSDVLASVKDMFSYVSVPASALSALSSAMEYVEKNAAKPMSSLFVSAMNNAADNYRLDGDIGTATAITEDSPSGTSDTSKAKTTDTNDSNDKPDGTSDNSDDSTNGASTDPESDTSSASMTKMTSVLVPASAAAIGVIAMLF